MMSVLLHNLVRRLAGVDYADGNARPVVNNLGDLSVSQNLLPKAELARLADSWSMMIPTGSAFTNVAGMPTTRAELVMHNGDTEKSCIIDTISFLSLTSITALSNATVIYQVQRDIAAPTDNTAVLINSPLGKTYSGNVKRALAVTTFTANKWTALAHAGNPATASIGFGVVAEVAGGIILPPGASLGINAVVGTATGTSLMGISWHERKLPVP